MRATTSGRLATGSLWLLLFMATRIRVKLNGTDAGKVLLVQDGWDLPDLIEAAKAKLLTEEQAAALLSSADGTADPTEAGFWTHLGL